MTRVAWFALSIVGLTACSPDVCSDIECVMAHLTLSINGKPAPLTAVPAVGLPVADTPPQTMNAGDFQLLIRPVSAPNWGDPVQMIEAGFAAVDSSGASSLAPRITNHPTDLSFASTSSEETLTLDWLDPNAAGPAFCFTPYTQAQPYPHCVWCTEAERDMANAGIANMRLGINAGVVEPIDFSASVGKACSNPTRPDGTSANPMRGCPTGTQRCGDGCIPTGTVCCNSPAGDTTSYCTNSAGGVCRVGVACAGSQNCCDPSGSFGSNDCGPTERHCGEQCVSRDRPCCPVGSTDPQCLAQAPLFAGPGVGVGVVAPQAPGGGGGGGGDFGDTCGYAGTYKGVFKYTAHSTSMPAETPGQITATFKLEHIVTAMDIATLRIVSAQIDDPSFGATAGVTPNEGTSLAILPCKTGTQGVGFSVFLPNGSHIQTEPGDGAFSASADLRTFSSTNNPAYTNMTWSGGTATGDSNTLGSGPGGYAYNATKFVSWTVTKQ